MPLQITTYQSSGALTFEFWHIQLSSPVAAQRWSCVTCLPPSGSTGPLLPAVHDTLSQQAWRGSVEMIHTRNCQQNTHIIVNKYKLLLQWVSRSIEIRGFEEPSYPVNHQKRIFDRKEASFTGQGFCNRLKTRLTVVFAVNLSPLKGFRDIHGFTEAVGRWLNGALVSELIMLMCVNSTVQSGGPLWGAGAMNSLRTE